jgi:hypothetical protein
MSEDSVIFYGGAAAGGGMRHEITWELMERAKKALDEAAIRPEQTHYDWVDGEIVELKPKRKQNLDVLRNRLTMYGMRLV